MGTRTYRIGPLEPGPYELAVDRPGYRPSRQTFSMNDSPLVRLTVGTLEWRLDLELIPPGVR